jgi:GntR family histidine utilization transcriptional repressor
LRDLAEKGLVERKRKAGTRGVQNPEHKATFVIPVTRLEVEAGGAVYRHQLLEAKNKKCTAAVAQRMSLERGSKVLYLRTLHMADDLPYAYEERWINCEAVPKLKLEALQDVSANEWLVNNAPFTRGDMRLGARQADDNIAELMQCKAGDALLEVERSTRSDKQCITFVRILYAPDYQLRTML